MKCPRCKEKIKNDAFMCKHCSLDIIPHSYYSIKRSIFNIFSSKKYAKCIMRFQDYSHGEKIAYMESMVSMLKNQGYDLRWGWDSDDTELTFYFKGDNFNSLVQLVSVLGRQVKSNSDGKISMSGLKID